MFGMHFSLRCWVLTHTHHIRRMSYIESEQNAVRLQKQVEALLAEHVSVARSTRVRSTFGRFTL